MKGNKEKIYDLVLYLGLALFTMCIATWALGFGTNFNLLQNQTGGDWMFTPFLVKSIQENGIFGIFYNPRVGAPVGSYLIDYPAVDFTMAAIIWVMSWFTKSTAKIIFAYYIFSFALDGVALTILVRKLKMKRAVAFMAGSVFAFAPYHIFRGMFHLTLINYMSIPIAIYLSLCILGYFENEKKWKIILAAVALGMGYGYYYAFGLILMAVAFLFRVLTEKNFKKSLRALWPMGAVLVSIVCALLPKILFGIINGKNTFTGVRLPIEQEIYGIRIIQLLLPPSYTRIPMMDQIVAEYADMAPMYIAAASLGLVTSVGFIVLCCALVYSFIVKKSCIGKEWKLIDFLSLSTLAFVLMGTTGGFGEIFNWAITAQIRDYSRSCVMIAALALIAMAYFIDKIKVKNEIVLWAVCLFIVGISIFDSVPVKAVDWQDEDASRQTCYTEFFSAVENQLENGAMVYQLPYLDFPEVDAEYDYKHFVSYLFTDTIKWSYGEVNGRTNEARKLLVNKGKSYLFLKNIQDAGFDAVYVDRKGYDDNGEEVLAFYDSLGIEPLVSSDGNMYLFDIRNYEIPLYKTSPGYSFVERWNSYFGIEMSGDDILEMAKGIGEMNEKTFESMYKKLSVSDAYKDMSDAEYVAFMYKVVLGRESVTADQNEWVVQLRNGFARKDMLYILLSSAEFRIEQSYDVVE